VLPKERIDGQLKRWGLANQRDGWWGLRHMILSLKFLNHTPDLQLNVRDGAAKIKN